MRMAISGICFLIGGAGAAGAAPMELTVGRLLDICEVQTVEAASAMGDELGWQRLVDPEWRASFVAYNGGSVDVVGWQRELAGRDESLVVLGSNRSKRSYSMCIFDDRSCKVSQCPVEASR